MLAQGITASQPLLSKAASRHSQRATEAGGDGPEEVNDVQENGTRVLGQKYEVLEVVGEGAYGRVMRCRLRGADPERFVAVKEFKITVSECIRHIPGKQACARLASSNQHAHAADKTQRTQNRWSAS
jgi:hypothetical protein